MESESHVPFEDAVKHCPLLSKTRRHAAFSLLLENGTVLSFEKGRLLTEYREKLGILLSGELLVKNHSGVLLNRLTPGSLFGVSTLFCENTSHVTDIFAAKKSEVLLICEDALTGILTENPDLFRNYIGFLTDRIRFLNRKIDLFSASTAEQKLLVYLRHERKEENGAFTVTLPSMAKLASLLGIGRASLYRAAEALEEQGWIRRESSKKWIVNTVERNEEEV